MAEVKWILVCDHAFYDQLGKPCIIGVFDIIHATAFPATHPVMAVIARLNGAPHEKTPVALEVTRPNGESLLQLAGEQVLDSAGISHRIFILNGFQFPEAGRYIFGLRVGQRQPVTIHVRVNQAVPGQAQPPSIPPGAQVH